MSDASARRRDRVLVVAGLAIEARIAAGPDIVTVCSGGDVRRLRALLDATDPSALRAVISFGLGGGLDPALRPGDVVVATEIVTPGNTWCADKQVVSALATRLSRTSFEKARHRVSSSKTVAAETARPSPLAGESAERTEVSEAGEGVSRLLRANGSPPHPSRMSLRSILATLSHEGRGWESGASRSGLVKHRLPVLARMAGSDVVVMDPNEKAKLHAGGHIAVDMESHVAAEFASARGLPFGVVRVICDSATRALPPLAQNALGAQGQVDIAGVLRSIAGNPRQLVDLWGVGRDFAAGIVALRRCRRLLGLGFGLDAGELGLDVL